MTMRTSVYKKLLKSYQRPPGNENLEQTHSMLSLPLLATTTKNSKGNSQDRGLCEARKKPDWLGTRGGGVPQVISLHNQLSKHLPPRNARRHRPKETDKNLAPSGQGVRERVTSRKDTFTNLPHSSKHEENSMAH